MQLSSYLEAAIGAWVVSQLLKYLIDMTKTRNFRNVGLILQSGGMPSVHSAVMAAVTTTIGINEGVTSGIFALALITSVIVMYDAMQVRRAVGEQGVALRTLLNRGKIGAIPYSAKGHLPLEVAVGAVIGVSVAFFITTFSL